jgi:hypothetical protein
VNLGRFGQRIFRDFELELAFANQLEERCQRLRPSLAPTATVFQQSDSFHANSTYAT